MKKILNSKRIEKCKCGCLFIYDKEDIISVTEFDDDIIKRKYHYVECPKCDRGVKVKGE